MESEAIERAAARGGDGAEVERAAASRRRLRMLFIVGFWTFFGALNGSQLYIGIRSEGTEAPLGQVFARQMLGWVPLALLTPVVLWLGRRFPLERPVLARNLSVHAAACAAFYVVHSLIFTFANILFSPFYKPPYVFLDIFYRSEEHTSELQSR